MSENNTVIAFYHTSAFHGGEIYKYSLVEFKDGTLGLTKGWAEFGDNIGLSEAITEMFVYQFLICEFLELQQVINRYPTLREDKEVRLLRFNPNKDGDYSTKVFMSLINFSIIASAKYSDEFKNGLNKLLDDVRTFNVSLETIESWTPEEKESMNELQNGFVSIYTQCKEHVFPIMTFLFGRMFQCMHDGDIVSLHFKNAIESGVENELLLFHPFPDVSHIVLPEPPAEESKQ